ncbi:MAG: glycosyltransferase family 2 protein [Verrucomicrobiota bacterium]
MVIPCFNEEACVEEVLVSWDAELAKRLDDYEIILVDDGSTDGTGEIVSRLDKEMERLRVLRQENRGHGPALLAGYGEASGDWVFHTDSDHQVEPEDFWKLWELRDESDYVMGVRADRRDPGHRLFVTAVLRWVMALLLCRRVRDINVPYKLVEGRLLEDMLRTIPKSTFAPSILMVQAAVHWGVPIAEVEVRHLPRTTGETTLKPLKLVVVCAQALVQSLLYRVLLFGEKRPSREAAASS